MKKHTVIFNSYTKFGRIILSEYLSLSIKKSMKIPKWKSESVSRRRTGNTKANRKWTKDKQRSPKDTHKTKTIYV